ncbi:MAG: GIDE domain-containing protein [Chloroflexales bacterium]
MIFLITAAFLAIAGLIAAIVAWRGEGSMIAIRETATLSVAEVFALHRAGRLGHAVEVMGTIECAAPLQAPYSEALCVAYSYTVSEDKGRLGYSYGYSPRHQHGLASRRGQQNIGHSLDHQGAQVPRFYVRDSTGRIAVDTAGAQIDMPETVARYESYTGGIELNVERQIWREEHAMPMGNRAYILAYLANDHGEPVLMRHPVDHRRRFIISHRDERALLAHTRRRAYGLYLFSGISIGAALIIAAFALHLL